MKLCTAAQMRALDNEAIGSLGVLSTLLMTNAARHVALAAMEHLSPGGQAAVFCGAGNNGGDGVYAAAYLLKHGVSVRAFLVGSREKMTADTREMERRLTELGGTLEDFETAALEDDIARFDVIIDALFGTGLNSDLRGAALEAVRLINASDAYGVAADIPSGVDADSGAIRGEAVCADLTVTFSFPKPGLFLEPGCTRCGDVRVVDIGIPNALLERIETDCFAVLDGDISLPARRRDTHKGDYGRDLVIAGSVGYTGAPVLSARAATLSGAGLVTLCVPEPIYPVAAIKCEGEMVSPLPGENGLLCMEAIAAVLEKLAKSDVCLIGPGLGRSDGVTALVSAVVKASAIPLIIDADGINAIAENIDILLEAKCPVILTPHPGEFQRLGGSLSEGRLEAARRFALRYGVILVLKGHRTVTALPDGTAYINTTGGPAMAKGGSGDILAGIIASLVGQKFPLKDAVLAAIWLHGRAGDVVAARYGEYSVTVGSLLDTLPEVFKAKITPG
jgi:NAD(P)H-hydrate epimerase